MTDTIGSPEAILQELLTAKKVVVTAHARPDGDALGSALALRRMLEQNGIAARIAGLEPYPVRFRFLIGHDKNEMCGDQWLESADLLVVLDCGAFDRVSPDILEAERHLRVINIDHHGSNTGFGAVNWISPSASSTGEMIWRLAKTAGWTIDERTATALWTALVTDTGRFGFENTTPEVMQIGANLLECGVHPQIVERNVFQSIELKEIRLSERALSRLALHEGGRVALVALTHDDFLDLGCTAENAQDIVNLPRQIAGVEIAVFLYELPEHGKVKVSLRTIAPYHAAEFCGIFGGGGHARAAGCSIPGDLDDALKAIIPTIHKQWFLPR